MSERKIIIRLPDEKKILKNKLSELKGLLWLSVSITLVCILMTVLVILECRKSCVNQIFYSKKTLNI